MIKAVIFDCFGVLTTDGWRQIREEYFADDAQLMQQALDLDKAVNAGMLEYDDFLKGISNLSGLPAAEVQGRLGKSVPNKLLFDYIKSNLKPHFKIGLLSNAADDWLDELFEPRQRELLDDAVLSYATGLVKPDPAMYHLAASRLEVTPEECIFIDDIERYCVAAGEVGMHSVWHTDSPQTIRRIEEIIHA